MPIERLESGAFPQKVAQAVAKHPEMEAIVRDYGVPDFWSRAEGFETLVRIILEQQVSLVSARLLWHHYLFQPGREKLPAILG